LVLELVFELFQLSALVLQASDIAVQPFLSIRESLFTTLHIGTLLAKLGAASPRLFLGFSAGSLSRCE
jgi:hypothetical protein